MKLGDIQELSKSAQSDHMAQLETSAETYSRVKSLTAREMARQGISEVDQFNRVNADSNLSQEILDVLMDTGESYDAQLDSERKGLTVAMGNDYYDVACEYDDLEQEASYAVQGEAAWSKGEVVQATYDTPETLQEGTTCLTHMAGFNSESFVQKQSNLRGKAARLDIEYAFTSKGKPRQRGLSKDAPLSIRKSKMAKLDDAFAAKKAKQAIRAQKRADKEAAFKLMLASK